MLSSYTTMDINILYSIINMKLRNEKQTLEQFCNHYQLTQQVLVQRLQNNDMIYDAQQNQFKEMSINELKINNKGK